MYQMKKQSKNTIDLFGSKLYTRNNSAKVQMGREKVKLKDNRKSQTFSLEICLFLTGKIDQQHLKALYQ